MLHKTRGVVLTFIRYKESSIIVKIFTEAFGLCSYIVNGARSQPKGRASGSKMALYQPLTLLDLVVYHRAGHPLERIAEVRLAHPYTSIPFDVRKSTVCLLLTEVLAKTLTEEKEDPELFDFLHQSLVELDGPGSAPDHFHLLFLLQLAHHLGFGATHAGEIAGQLGHAGHFFDHDRLAQPLHQLCLADSYAAPVGLDRASRTALLDAVLQFYALHVENFGELKSLAVLREL
jgi:DNA repair protein RecO (recombination protein O)